MYVAPSEDQTRNPVEMISMPVLLPITLWRDTLSIFNKLSFEQHKATVPEHIVGNELTTLANVKKTSLLTIMIWHATNHSLTQGHNTTVSCQNQNDYTINWQDAAVHHHVRIRV